MEGRDIDRLVEALGAAGPEGRREAVRGLLAPLLADEAGGLPALMGRLEALVAAAARTGDPHLTAFVLDALEAAPDGQAARCLEAALSAGGRLAEGARRLERALPLEAMAHLGAAALGLTEGRAKRLLTRLYPGRRRLTCAQLAAALACPRRREHPSWLEAQHLAWRRGQGRPVPEGLLPLALAQRPPAAAEARDARLLQAPGLDAERLRLVRGLMARSAGEAAAAYRLAARLSAALGRPVVTLHNVTLGGFSAWGVPDFAAQSPAGRGLAREAARLAEALQPDPALLAEAVRERLEGLTLPRLHWLLSGLRLSCALEGDLTPYEGWLARARELLPDLAEPPRLAFPFKCQAGLEAALAETLTLARYERERLPELMRLLAALWLAAATLMAAGRLRSFVIPVADKFVASSSRGQAVGYLAALLRCLLAAAPEARCLLFDSSPNPASPSLRYTPAALAGHGVAALGLGIFSQEWARPRSLAELRGHPEVRLFLVEPREGAGRRGAERLHGGDATLLSASGYDPAWKEAVPWLTSGTRLAELREPWLPGPGHEGRVLTSRGPLPGGVLYRLTVRRRLGLPESAGRRAEGRLWRRWVRLARLD